MPTFRPYSLTPGQHLEIEVVQPDGGRALIVGRLESVPLMAGFEVMRMVVRADDVRALPAEGNR